MTSFSSFFCTSEVFRQCVTKRAVSGRLRLYKWRYCTVKVLLDDVNGPWELGSAVSPCLVLISWPHILSLRSESQTPDTNITLEQSPPWEERPPWKAGFCSVVIHSIPFKSSYFNRIHIITVFLNPCIKKFSPHDPNRNQNNKFILWRGSFS